jgi:hypothetical protein
VNKFKKTLLGLDGINGFKSNVYLDIHLNHNSVRKWLRTHVLLDVKIQNPDNVRDSFYFFKNTSNMILFRQILWNQNEFSLKELRKNKFPEGKKSSLRIFIDSLFGIDD